MFSPLGCSSRAFWSICHCLSLKHTGIAQSIAAECRTCLCLPSFFFCIWSRIDSCYHAVLALLVSVAWWSNLSLFMAEAWCKATRITNNHAPWRRWGPAALRTCSIHFSGWCLECFHGTFREILACKFLTATACCIRGSLWDWNQPEAAFATINRWSQYLIYTQQVTSPAHFPQFSCKS